MASFTVVLTAQPATDVVLIVTSGDTGEAVVSPDVLTFTPANWNSLQMVTVTGVDDFDRDGDQVTSLTVAVDAAQSDDRFVAVAAQAVAVTTIDNDVGWSNPRNPFDVDDSGKVDAADVLTIVNHINGHSNDPSLPPPPAVPPPFYDVNHDDLCMPGDVLLVINYINNHVTGSGESEGALRKATAWHAAAPVTPSEPGKYRGAEVQRVPRYASGPQIAGESASRPAIATHPGPVSILVRTRRTADLHSPTRPRLTTESTAGRQKQALGAALETWEDGVEDDLVAVLAQDIDRCSW